jgi:phage terminase large subunit
MTSKPTLNPACVRSGRREPNKVLYGGRSSSKSWDAAGFAIFWLTITRCVFSARQIQNKIEESVYALLKIQINRFGLRHRFRILDNKIINRHTGAEFIFYGLWRTLKRLSLWKAWTCSGTKRHTP